MSARIVENGFKTVKLWLKQGAKGLFVKVLKQQGLKHKDKGLNWDYFFKRLGRRVDFRKPEGFFCKNARVDRHLAG